MAWPCRRELWDEELAAAKPSTPGWPTRSLRSSRSRWSRRPRRTPRRRGRRSRRASRSRSSPIDDSWLRDSGPIFVVDDGGAARRAGAHFGFNAWGERFPPYDKDAAVGGILARAVLGRRPHGADGPRGRLDHRRRHGHARHHRAVPAQPQPQPGARPRRDRAPAARLARRGPRRVAGPGLVEDRDTDGHVDLIATFTQPGTLLLQSAPPESPDHEPMAENRERALARRARGRRLPPLAYASVGGEDVVASYLNLYVGNGFVVVPTAGAPSDEDAMERIARRVRGPRGRRRAGHHGRLRRRGPALHHPAGAGAGS